MQLVTVCSDCGKPIDLTKNTFWFNKDTNEVRCNDCMSIHAYKGENKAETTEEETSETPIFNILKEANSILTGDRAKDYGDAYSSFKRIADYWGTYLNRANISPRDVAMMLILFKVARENNKHKHDNLVDIIGYATLADTIEQIENEF